MQFSRDRDEKCLEIHAIYSIFPKSADLHYLGDNKFRNFIHIQSLRVYIYVWEEFG